jgi:hypothetical protein
VSRTPSSDANLQAALANSLERLCRLHQALGNLFTAVGEGTRYRLAENDNCLAGFWIGLLWLTYAATRDEQLCAFIERVRIAHDLGFPFTLSTQPQWQIIHEQAVRRYRLWGGSAPDSWGSCRP